jgi:glucokinase
MEHKFKALNGLNVIKLLKKRWSITALNNTLLRVANDADLFALGEWWAGAARDCDSVIGLTLGTGLGSGFIRCGGIIASGREVPESGEIWNLPYLGGIAEDYACGAAITRDYRRATELTLTAEEIAHRAADQDTAACAAFKELGTHLVGILEPHIKQFKPSCVVIGGNIARAWPLFGPHLQATWETVECRPFQRFEEAALLGAAVLADCT